MYMLVLLRSSDLPCTHWYKNVQEYYNLYLHEHHKLTISFAYMRMATC